MVHTTPHLCPIDRISVGLERSNLRDAPPGLIDNDDECPTHEDADCRDRNGNGKPRQPADGGGVGEEGLSAWLSISSFRERWTSQRGRAKRRGDLTFIEKTL